MKCVPVHHGIPAVLHRDEPWLHRHSENGALTKPPIPLDGDCATIRSLGLNDTNRSRNGKSAVEARRMRSKSVLVVVEAYRNFRLYIGYKSATNA